MSAWVGARRRCDKNRWYGFSLIELLVALVIVIIVMIGLWSVYIMSMTAWEEGSTQISIQRTASILMEKMVRGIDGKNGIREANTVNIPLTTKIEYVSGIDGMVRSFYLDASQQLVYDPDIATSDDETIIASGVDVLNFSLNGRVVTIDLRLQEQVKGEPRYVELTTQVTLRN